MAAVLCSFVDKNHLRHILFNILMHTFKLVEATEEEEYLAGIEMSIDLDDDLVIFIRCLFSGDHHLSCCQVLQLIHLETQILGRS